MTKRKKRLIAAILIIMVLVGTAVGVPGVIASAKIDVEKILIEGGGSSSPITVVHISDLHYPKNRISLQELEEKLEEISPDLIFLTGDIIDKRTPRESIGELESFFSAINARENVYAVLGNHENINKNQNYYRDALHAANITLLENAYRALDINGRQVVVAGLADGIPYDSQTLFGEGFEGGTLLLIAHRPEMVDSYIAETNQVRPLVTFAGHAHGGQFRFFGQGFVAPHQGLFTRYSTGLYSFEGCHMVVSRGLGESLIPFRMFNPYHLPVVEIY